MTESQKGILEMLAQNAPVASIANRYKNHNDFEYLRLIGAINYEGNEFAVGSTPILLAKGPNFTKYYRR